MVLVLQAPQFLFSLTHLFEAQCHPVLQVHLRRLLMHRIHPITSITAHITVHTMGMRIVMRMVKAMAMVVTNMVAMMGIMEMNTRIQTVTSMIIRRAALRIFSSEIPRTMRNALATTTKEPIYTGFAIIYLPLLRSFMSDSPGQVRLSCKAESLTWATVVNFNYHPVVGRLPSDLYTLIAFWHLLRSPHVSAGAKPMHFTL